MKRSFIILMAASALAALSCTKEVNDQTAPEKEQVTMSFDATIGAPTKVELGEATADGYKVNWSVGDEIAVFPSDPALTEGSVQKGDPFTTTITATSSNATFTGEVEAGVNYYAVYPYDAAVYWSEKYDNAVVELAANQEPNGIASGIAVATAEGTSLKFEHVTGYIKFAIPAEYTDIKEVRFSGNNGEPLAGQYYVYRDNGQTANKFSNTKSTELSLVPAEGNVFASGTYYFTAFPAELTKGVTITFVKSDDTTASKSTDDSKPASVKAGDILNLGTITGLNFEALADELVVFDLQSSSYSSATAEFVKWTNDYVVMTLDKNTSSTSANNYLGGTNEYTHTRVYKDQILTLTSPAFASIDKIEFESTSNDYAAKFVSATWTNADVEQNATKVVVTPKNASSPVSVTINEATRFTSVTIYLDIDENYVPPTLESITLSGDYKTEFTEGDDFIFGGVVTAIYDDESTVDVTDEAIFSGYDMNNVATQTVTVTYKDKSATYSIAVAKKPDNAPIKIVLDLSKNIFNFSSSKANDAVNEITKTYDGYTYKFKATESLYYYSSKALFIGKKDSYITFPAIDNYKLVSVEAHNCSGASAKAMAVICSTANTTAVNGGAASSIAAGGSQTWTLSDTNKGTSYRIYINNAYALQFTKIVLTYQVN